MLPTLNRGDRTWQAMQARATWRIGVDPSFPPFEQLDSQGQVIGFDVDLAKAIAAQWGMKVEVVAISFDSLIDTLKAGQIDSVFSALPYDPRLTRDIAYSSPYFEAGIRLVVRSGSPISSTADLTGRQIAVELGSAGDTISRQLQRTVPSIAIKRYETPDETIAALEKNDSIDAVLIDNVSLRMAQGRGASITAVAEPLEPNPYVIAVPLDATELLQILETTLRSLQESGEIAKLEARWFGKSVGQ